MFAEIKKAYITPGTPIAYSAPGLIKKYYPTARNENIKNTLAALDSYTLHRQFRRKKIFNPYYIYFKREQLQADLIDVQHLKLTNDLYAYIMTVIDCFTKRAFIRLLKDKTGPSSLEAIKAILIQTGDIQEFCTDFGKEFTAAIVENYLKGKNIKIVHPYSEGKASMVERFNRSLQSLMYKHMSENQTTRYVDVLSDLLSTYNNREHRSIGMSPNMAELPENQDKVRNMHNRKYSKVSSKRKKPKLKIGDLVRIKTQENVFGRGYTEQFSREQYEIVKVNTRMPLPMYTLKSLDDNLEVEGDFYENEITKMIVEDGIYKVEKVLKSRLRPGGKKQHFVKWMGFNDTHNSWIDDTSITRDYRQ